VTSALLAKRARTPAVQLLHTGKVRDVYQDGDDLVLVASDRVSVYDVVLPTPVPGKGAVLTGMSAWWFDQLVDVVSNHVISTVDVPDEFADRAMRVQKLDIIQVECVARGYLAGGGWDLYRSDGAICGVELPEGLALGDQLPEPIFTPTTKTPPEEGHDEPLTFAQVVDRVGSDTAERLRDLTLDIYRRASEIVAERGVILVDTKFEFGLDPDGKIVWADEALTTDSSRFWRVEDWEPGGKQVAWDKQYVRDWASDLDWDKTAPGPEIPAEVVAETRLRYLTMYERITGLGVLDMATPEERHELGVRNLQVWQDWRRRMSEARESGATPSARDLAMQEMVRRSPQRYSGDRPWASDDW